MEYMYLEVLLAILALIVGSFCAVGIGYYVG